MSADAQDPTTTTIISQRDQRRIQAAMTRMPYAASQRVPKPWTAMGESVDVDAVVAFLEGLAVDLTEVGEPSAAEHRRLSALESDVAAFRRILGTAPGEVDP